MQQASNFAHIRPIQAGNGSPSIMFRNASIPSVSVRSCPNA